MNDSLFKLFVPVRQHNHGHFRAYGPCIVLCMYIYMIYVPDVCMHVYLSPQSLALGGSMYVCMHVCMYAYVPEPTEFCIFQSPCMCVCM